MSEHPKVSTAHRQKTAIVYVRQSTLAQLERNQESTTRQYDLVDKAVALGWPRGAVRVVDEDQGVSGSSAIGRSGFAELAAQVGLGRWGSCWRWRYRGWPETTPTGIDCWTWPG